MAARGLGLAVLLAVFGVAPAHALEIRPEPDLCDRPPIARARLPNDVKRILSSDARPVSLINALRSSPDPRLVPRLLTGSSRDVEEGEERDARSRCGA